ncbi:TonB-dependent receptor [Sphingomonas sp.]|uniref:TonB-dependent receptor n=1 Tax=Sphingomonas sp. TaxID=28214 RepID=UPI0025CF3FD3|nr:TonB-dependent receptor [Sphingomonas sp.]MBV9528119.1 TonB-dependent receptor [Sphingomonas sp.]
MRASNAVILSSISLIALTASPAYGQATPAAPVDTTPQKTQDSEKPRATTSATNAQGQPVASEQGPAIVVTGSRIRRNNFNTPQNVDIITRDDQILAGTRSTSEVLQSATVTSGTSQINGSFLGYLSDNGQAASTVGLRGLGSQRTLVLLNGRRLAPAGVGPQLVAADLNVLPTSLVQRIEVLREGASSIYGSDAIAGVINIITDTSINGVTLDGYSDHPLYAKYGDTMRASITAGKTFSRGHITGAFEFRNDQGLRLGDRKDTSCVRELAYRDDNNQEVGQMVPGGTALRCFPFERDVLGSPQGYGVGASFNGAPGVRLSLQGYDTGNPTLFGPPANVRPGAAPGNYSYLPETRKLFLDNTVQSPIKTFTGYLNGAYDLGILGDAELYGEGLFTRRLSHQWSTDRIDYQSVPNYDQAQLYGGNYAGTPLEQYGFPVTPFFPVAWANAGYNYFGPFIMPNRLFEQKQKVDFWRANGGLRGNLGFGDWRYDANVQLSRTKSREDVQTPLGYNLGNTAITALAPSGVPGQYTVTALPGQVGAGNVYTCASNLTDGAYNGGKCVPINFFDPNVLINGNLPQAAYDYLYPMVNYTRTKFKDETYSLALDGTLFQLPGGAVKAAVGVERRHSHIEDRPGAERAAGDLLYYGTAGNTIGSDTVNEAYAEFDAPILKDRPFFNLLEIEGSGRYTHYQSYGNGFTYHASAQWSPIPALRFRGNYGTNFRAPNLYEQFIADEVGYYGVSVDPCVNFAAQYQPTDTVYKNCLAALTPILGNNATKFDPPGGSIPVTTSGGRGVLKAEKARTYGFGAVVTVPRRIADISLSADYWHVKVKGEVGQLGNLILTYCYEATDFATNPYCALIGPRLTVDQVVQPDQAGVIGSFRNPYVNISKQIASGIDFDARFATPLFGGNFQAQLQATRNLSQKLEIFPGQGLTEYNGTLGYPGQNGGPKWVGTLDARFKTASNITLRWGVKYIGPSNSQDQDPHLTINTCEGDPTPCPTKIHYDLTAEAYWEHGASVQFEWPNVGQITFGMNNIFNAKPPVISSAYKVGYSRFGNFFGGGAYDYRGRSAFVNVTRSFK